MKAPLAYRTAPQDRPALGLIVLQNDETLEREARMLLPAGVDHFVSRVPSGLDVTAASLAAMEAHLPAAAALFPEGRALASVGYACTSGTAQIGAERVAALVRSAALTGAVTDPLTALVAICRRMGVSRLAFLSPYLPDVSERIRGALAAAGIETPVTASFGVSREAVVARIETGSLVAAAAPLAAAPGIDALFLSCTNLATLDAIPALRATAGVPVLSSNVVLCWHMAELAGLSPPGHPALPRL